MMKSPSWEKYIRESTHRRFIKVMSVTSR